MSAGPDFSRVHRLIIEVIIIVSLLLGGLKILRAEWQSLWSSHGAQSSSTAQTVDEGDVR